MAVELTQTQMAEAFGVRTRTIRNWEAEGELRFRTDGNRKLYDLAAAIAWRLELERDAAVAVYEGSALDAAKLRKLEAEADAKELDLGIKRGELVPIDDVEGLVREALETVGAVMRHAPSRFAPQLAQLAGVSIRKARAILEDVVEMIRASVRENGNGG